MFNVSETPPLHDMPAAICNTALHWPDAQRWNALPLAMHAQAPSSLQAVPGVLEVGVTLPDELPLDSDPLLGAAELVGLGACGAAGEVAKTPPGNVLESGSGAADGLTVAVESVVGSAAAALLFQVENVSMPEKTLCRCRYAI